MPLVDREIGAIGSERQGWVYFLETKLTDGC